MLGRLDTRFPADLCDEALSAARSVLTASPRVRWAYVFGSVARGESFADLDVGVRLRGDARVSLRDLARLARRIEDALAAHGIPVDLFDVSAFSLPMIDAVLRDGVVIVDREPAERRLWEMGQTLLWWDFRPTWDAQTRLRHEVTR